MKDSSWEFRRRLGTSVIIVMAVTAFVAGIWGYGVSMPDASQPAARSRFETTVQGGMARVDRVAPESMAPMQMGKFAAAGMNMSGSVVDMTPEGFRRFEVEITLAADARGGLRFNADEFLVIGRGLEATKPYRHSFKVDRVAYGTMISGTIVYQVPNTASQIELSLPGADRAIPMSLGPVVHEDSDDSFEDSSSEDSMEEHSSNP